MTMFWIGVSGVVLAAVGAGTGAYSAVASGENAKETADYNAKIQNNAALDAQQRGAQAAAEHQDKVRRMIGTQIATEASNGLLTNTGTPLNILTDTAGMGKLDALRLLSNAGRQAQGFDEQSGLLTIQGKNAQAAGSLNAGATALGGLSSAANGFYTARKPQTTTIT